ncbi:MAG: hypothetical protein ACE5NC_00180 [Anaerolineae bacterium]
MAKRRTRPPTWQQRALIVIGILVALSMAVSLLLPAVFGGSF